MKSYDAFLFDWDGTLADTVRLSLDLMEQHCHKYGLSPSRTDIARHLGDWTAAIYLGLPASELEQFNSELRAVLTEQMMHPPLHPDALAVLQTLQAKGKKTALITSTFREVVSAVVAYHNLSELFTVIVTAEDVAKPKPDPEGVFLALQTCGVVKSKALMVGDTDVDMLAARNADVDSMLFFPPGHESIYSIEQLRESRPQYVIHSWRQLLDNLE